MGKNNDEADYTQPTRNVLEELLTIIKHGQIFSRKKYDQ